MHVTELLDKADDLPISYEIIPPRRGTSANALMATVDDLMQFDPPFIDVTSHSAEVEYKESPDGTWHRRVKRKRPGTVGICAAIKGRHGVETVPHILCHGFNRSETEDVLIELDFLGIHNVMALHGDDTGLQKKPGPGVDVNKSALDLVTQIDGMNQGRYQDAYLNAHATNFCVGVAGYPEKHFKAPNLAWDVEFLKRKVDAGAHYVTTQMFFDPRHYVNFVSLCRKAGIVVPIIPGLKVLTTKRQLLVLPSRFYVEIPEDLAAEVAEAKDEHVKEVGINWCVSQCEALMNAGVPCLHFYVMQRSAVVRQVVSRLRAL